MNFHHIYNFRVLAALSLGCFFMVGCENSDKEIYDLTSRRIGVEEALNVSINYTIGGKIKSRLSAPFMLRHQDSIPFIEFTKTVHADFYDDQMKIETKLDARYGKYIESQSLVYLKDSVVMFNTFGDTLYCTELYWDRNKPGKEFYTNKPVRIRTKSHTENGTGMDAPQDFRSWHLLNPFGTVKVPASQF